MYKSKLYTWLFSASLIFSLISFSNADYTHNLPSVHLTELVTSQQGAETSYQLSLQKKHRFFKQHSHAFSFDLFLKVENKTLLNKETQQKSTVQTILNFCELYTQLPSSILPLEQRVA